MGGRTTLPIHPRFNKPRNQTREQPRAEKHKPKAMLFCSTPYIHTPGAVPPRTGSGIPPSHQCTTYPTHATTTHSAWREDGWHQDRRNATRCRLFVKRDDFFELSPAPYVQRTRHEVVGAHHSRDPAVT